MNIVFTINEVFRDFLTKVDESYVKYVDPDFEITNENEYDLYKRFNKNTNEEIDEFNVFLYETAVLPCFGYSKPIHKQSALGFNLLSAYMKDYYGDEVNFIICDVGKQNDIPSTYFFLSKIACRCPNIKFVDDLSKIWEHSDVLITANPQLLKEKPKDKYSIKINSNYNKDVDADNTYDSVYELYNNKEVLEKIIDGN